MAKLIRDQIPALAAAKGQHLTTTIATPQEYRAALRDKLREETTEFLVADETGAPEELADVLEVVQALAVDLGLDTNTLEKIRETKRAERGGFDCRLLLHAAAPVPAGSVRLSIDALTAERDALADTVERVRAFAVDMRDWCSPHGVAAVYADRLLEVLDGPSTDTAGLSSDTAEQTPAPTDWIDGHPQLEAIAARVWKRCSHDESSRLVLDDPRNIAVAALAAIAGQTPAPPMPGLPVWALKCSCGGQGVTHFAAEHHEPTGPVPVDPFAGRACPSCGTYATGPCLDHGDPIECTCQARAGLNTRLAEERAAGRIAGLIEGAAAIEAEADRTWFPGRTAHTAMVQGATYLRELAAGQAPAPQPSGHVVGAAGLRCTRCGCPWGAQRTTPCVPAAAGGSQPNTEPRADAP